MEALTLALLLLSQASLASPAKAIDVGTQDSKVEFLAVGRPSLMKIRGTGGKLKGKLELSGGSISGELSVPLDPVKTGIELRDEHMKKKYLETEKFPEATLTISSLTLEQDPLEKNFTAKDVPFKGKLKVHGVEQDVTGSLDVISEPNRINVSARVKTNITSHKIDLPSYLGIKVADDVEIFAELKLKK